MSTRTLHTGEHEQVAVHRDPASGLHAIIAVHDTTLGPAVGGCRMWPYRSEAAALHDALRLSRCMSYKSALAELPLGGGKAVIVGNPETAKTPALLRAFGRFVEQLGGRYLVGEDVGISVDDVEAMARETRHTCGRSRASGSSGDPSPLTARGVLAGIRACLVHRRDGASLAGLRVAVQGLGHVGYELCRLLHEQGAELLVSDLCQERLARAVDELGATAVEPGRILEQPVDVLAPCALGAVLNDDSVPHLRTGIVAGAANNPLAEERHGDLLASRGVLFAPDYVINAGGIINIAAELRGPPGPGRGAYDPDWALARVDRIHDRLLSIFRESQTTGRPPHRIARARARRKLRKPQAA